MLEKQKLEAIVNRYLTAKRNAVPPRILKDDDGTGLVFLKNIFNFYHDLCGDLLNLEAIASTEPHTQEVYKDQANLLFKLIDTTLTPSFQTQAGEEFVITGFDQNKARALWSAERRKLDTSLKALHADIRNLGVAEKFLAGKLHGQEWLTDLDFERLVEAYDIKDTIGISTLDATDLGNTLYLRRRDVIDNKKPYKIPLLINTVKKAGVKGQGSHWTGLIIEVDPEKKEIRYSYNDSIKRNEKKQDEIKRIIAEALNYNDGTASAFPGYKIVEQNIVCANEQKNDSWSCGYHAIKYLVDRVDFPVENANLKALKDVKGVTAENLRRPIYKTLIGTAKIPVEAISEKDKPKKKESRKGKEKENAKEISQGKFVIDGPNYRVNDTYLDKYNLYVGTVKPNRTPVGVSAKKLENLMKIDARAAELKESTMDVLMKQVDASGKLSLSFSFLLKDVTEKSEQKAIIKALVNALNEHPEITHLYIVGLEKIEDIKQGPYFRKEFDKILAVTNFEIRKISPDIKSFLQTESLTVVPTFSQTSVTVEDEDESNLNASANVTPETPATPTSSQASSPLARDLEIIGARNALMDVLKLKRTADEDVWTQLWHARITDSSLYNDKANTQGELGLYSRQDSSFQPYIAQMGHRYLDELFQYLEENQSYFESLETGFSYQTLVVGTTPLTEKGLNIAYLDSLIRHLSKEPPYFPFKKITIGLNDFIKPTPPQVNSEYDFVKLKTVLELANKIEGLEAVELNMMALQQGSFRYVELDADQYKELCTLFKDKEISYDFSLGNISDYSPPDAIAARIELENTISINKRKHADEQQVDSVVEPSAPASAPSSSDKVRPYKLQGNNFRSNLALEVNIEEEVDVQQQHQLQTQLQQEMQQEVQVQQQHQSEFEDTETSVSDADKLFTIEKYSEEKTLTLYNSQLMSSSGGVVISSQYVMHNLNKPVYWYKAFSILNLANNIHYVDPAALSRIHAHPQYFFYGLNIDNLPVGFFVQRHAVDGKLVLSYDETKYIENKNQSPLTVKVISVAKGSKWPGDLRIFIPDAKDPEYNAEQIASFNGVYKKGNLVKAQLTSEKLFLFMKGMNPPAQPNLADLIIKKHEWCFTEDAAKPNKHFATGQNIYVLMDVLYSDGLVGLNNLLDALKVMHDKDPKFYTLFKSKFIDADFHSEPYLDNIRILLKGSNLDIIRKLADMTPVQKEWWHHLVSQHKQWATQVELADLYNGFQYFLNQLPKDIDLPMPCPLDNCDNMLVGLDRLLAVLGKVKPRNLRDQMTNLEKLDFDQEGAWYAARWEGFHYFHDAMKLSNEFYNKETEKSKIAEKYIQFEKDVLDRDELTYKVEYAQLKTVALALPGTITDLEYPSILFHRFIGRADRINESYQYYVDLIEKLQAKQFDVSISTKLLALLAVATTGHRGSISLDPDPLFTFIENNKADIEPVLTELVTQFETLRTKPNLEELTALVMFMSESNEDAKEVLKAFIPNVGANIDTPQLSDKTLSALSMWSKNPTHLEADDYLAFYEELKAFDEKNIDSLAKIAALIKQPYDQGEATLLIAALRNLKAKEAVYDETLRLLSSIDVKASTDLPMLEELKKVIDDRILAKIDDANKVYPELKDSLPKCVFDLASNVEVLSTEISASLEEKMREFKLLLESNSITSFDEEMFKQILEECAKKQGPEASQYDKLRNYLNDGVLKDIREKVPGFDIVLPGGIKPTQRVVYNQIMDNLKAMVFGDVDQALQEFPLLKSLQTPGNFPEPKLSHNYDGIPDDFIELKKYADNQGQLFCSLRNCYKKWNVNFTLKFLINSPRKHAFTSLQLKTIFDAVYDIESTYIPTSILTAIFSDKPLKEGTDTQTLANQIRDIIGLNEFSLNERAKIIEIVCDAKDPENAQKIIGGLKAIKDAYPFALAGSFKLFATYYAEHSGTEILDQIEKLLSVMNENNAEEEAKIKALMPSKDTQLTAEEQKIVEKSRKTIEENKKLSTQIIDRIGGNLSALEQITNVLDAVPEKSQHTFLKIVAHSCFEQEDDAKQIERIVGTKNESGIIQQLQQLIVNKPDDFEALQTLYSDRPYPKLAKLSQFLQLHAFGKFITELEALGDNQEWIKTLILLRFTNVSEENVETAKKEFVEIFGSRKKPGLLQQLHSLLSKDAFDVEKIIALSDKIFKFNKDLSIDDLPVISQVDRTRFAAWVPNYSDKIPTLNFEKLPEAVETRIGEFTERYELDPPGLRPGGLKSQFDMETAHQRIDGILDLSRHSNPLFYSERAKLYSHMVYVNGVGKGDDFRLAIPGKLENRDALRVKKTTELTKSELQSLIRHYRSIIKNSASDEKDVEVAKLEFVALAREAMYRSTGKFPYSTQTIALLNAMMHGGNIFSEVRTGEGKGCITALFAASEWMKGRPVDVCSANMELARRDLEEFGDFYEYLGIETSLITAKSKPHDYKSDGIQYSDVAQFALYQEQMQLFHDGVLPETVSCVMDEADFIALDSTTQYRFATSLDPAADPHINPNEWAYPVILEFVSREGFVKKKCDYKIDIDDLKRFVRDHQTFPKGMKSKFFAYSDTQLDKWIDAAYTASKLVEGEDFVVRDTKIIRQGQEIEAQVAKVKIDHRVSNDSSLSNGVHQFLHTRLNVEMDTKKRPASFRFPIEPEKTYLAAKSSKNFIDYYMKRGNVLGLTGTVGSTNEIRELYENYRFKFYKIPPHKPLLRKDHNPILAKANRSEKNAIKKAVKERAVVEVEITAKKTASLDPMLDKEVLAELNAEITALEKSLAEKKTAEIIAKEKPLFRLSLERIRLARKRGQPILIIFDGVDSSQRFYDYLKAKGNEFTDNNLQLFNGEQLDKKEKDVVERAGLSGMITVTTPMLGRGTDVKPHWPNGEFMQEGLHVIDTFIAPDRDYGQKIGRGGRNGARGDTQLIVSEAEFERYEMPIPKNTAELKKSIETVRARLNNENARERIKRQYFADVKDQFFVKYIEVCKQFKENTPPNLWKAVSHKFHLDWERFLNKIDGLWNELLIELQNELVKNPEATEDELLKGKDGEVGKVDELVTFANDEWKKTIASLQEVRQKAFVAAQQDLPAEEVTQLEGMPIAAPPLEAPKEVEIKAFVATPFAKPDATVTDVTVPTQIHYRPLEPAKFNPTEVYLDISSSDDATLKRTALEAKIGRVYETVLPEKKIGWFAKYILRRKPEEAPQDPGIKVTLILEKILDEFHNIRDPRHYNPASIDRIKILHAELMEGIAKFGDDLIKQRVLDAYKVHIQDHTNDAIYVQQLTQAMHTLRTQGAIKEDAPIGGHAALSSWQELRAGVIKQLKQYKSIFNASDRNREVERLLGVITLIDNSGALPGDAQKISALITEINTSSLEAVKSDYEHDQKSLGLFSHRNKDGSKFQFTLMHIHDQAMTHLVSDQSVKPDSNKDEITYLKDLLTKLRERANLPKLRKNKDIDNLGKDEVLRDLISDLDVNDLKGSEQKLQVISEKLRAYKARLNQTELNNDSQRAFKHFFMTVNNRLNRFKLAQEQIEQHEGLREVEAVVVFSSNENRVRAQIQDSMQNLLKHRKSFDSKHINLDKYSEVVIENSDDKDIKLIQSALFEIERAIVSQYPGSKSVKFAVQCVNNDLNITIEFIDKDQKQLQMDLKIDSFCDEKKDFVLCEWPNVVDKDVAIIKKSAQLPDVVAADDEASAVDNNANASPKQRVRRHSFHSQPRTHDDSSENKPEVGAKTHRPRSNSSSD